MALVASSQPNKTLKFFSSNLYKIRARSLDYLNKKIKARQCISILQLSTLDKVRTAVKRGFKKGSFAWAKIGRRSNSIAGINY